jgi:hypothetical protein
MATLINTRKSWLQAENEDLTNFLDRIQKIFEELQEKEPEKLISFPVADGAAVYYLKSEKPLKLEHIPVGDAWTVSQATIRGLRIQDIK